MADYFFYGTLCHPPQLTTLLGHPAAVEPASLPGHSVWWAEGQPFPFIRPDAGGRAEGHLARGLSEADAARLDFYEGGLGYRLETLTVQGPTGPVPAKVWLPPPDVWAQGPEWNLADWVRDWFAIANATLADVVAAQGTRPAAEVLRRYPQMLVRGASRVRAMSETAPATLRRDAGPDDVRRVALHQPYAHFFAAEEYDLSHRRFDGTMSRVINRAAFVMADAVTVLPYDPVRDRVLLIEQFRAGPLARGDRNPWQIEAVAGRIDAGETPEAAARREAAEEAGLQLGALLHVRNYYPSPGAVTEFLYSYVALTDLPDGVAGVFGVADEAEDIRGHLVPFARMMDLIASGEIANAPLILTALWLQRERPRLRAAAG
ncbi:MAG: NUDIX domain-containing protein [Paracoccaceae bacterium]